MSEPKGKRNGGGRDDAGEWDEIDVEGERRMGRGLRLSAWVLGGLLLAGGAVGWLLRRPAPDAEVRVTELSAPRGSDRPEAARLPTVRFTDITASAGITFVHETGAYGEKLLPETMGGGVAFLDYDGDGDPDLLFVNGTFWPWDDSRGVGAKPPPGLVLYRNDTERGGPVRFVEVTSGSGLEAPFQGMGVAVGDYDNDGYPDLYVTGVGGGRMFRNLGNGRFEDVTVMAGVGGEPTDWSTAAAWLDYDGDGALDLFVGNYVRWSRELDAEVGFKIDGTTRAYGPPMQFQGAFPRLYRNRGDGTFEEVARQAGLQVRNPATGVPLAKTLGVAVVDVNEDGWVDLLVANDTVQNLFFENQGDGTFKEVGALSGIAFDNYGNTRGAMGIDAARFTPDGALGVVIGNFANEMTALYVSERGSGLFTDDAIPWGIGPASRLLLKFGIFFFDYDLDGRLDVLTANGHLEEAITRVQSSQTYRQPAQLFWNAGDAGFLAVDARHAGEDLFRPLVGRGSAYADVDGDGDLDVILTQVGGPPLLLRNDLDLPHASLRLRLVGTDSPRDAAGARVEMRVGNVSQWRTASTTRGYLSASEPELTFGLGEASGADWVEVTWPSGSVQRWENLPAGRHVLGEKPR